MLLLQGTHFHSLVVLVALYTAVDNLSLLTPNAALDFTTGIIHLYADLPGMHTCVTCCGFPQASVPSSPIVTLTLWFSMNPPTQLIVLLELTCPLNSTQHFKFTRDFKLTMIYRRTVYRAGQIIEASCDYSTVALSRHYWFTILPVHGVCNATSFTKQASVISKPMHALLH